jgi:hypothetical protein
MNTMDEIAILYRLKDSSVCEPSTYLGANIIEYTLPDDRSKIRWGFSSHNCITDAL